MCLTAVARLPHVHIFFSLPCVLDYIFLSDVSWSETVSLGSGISGMPWSAGAIKEGLIPGDPKG